MLEDALTEAQRGYLLGPALHSVELKAPPGLRCAETTFTTTQWFLPSLRIRRNRCLSNIETVPLWRNDAETERPSTASG